MILTCKLIQQYHSIVTVPLGYLILITVDTNLARAYVIVIIIYTILLIVVHVCIAKDCQT